MIDFSFTLSVEMLEEASRICSDTSVSRRLSFAAATLHRDTPRYWELITEFGFRNTPGSTTPPCSEVKVLLENVQYLEEEAFQSDSLLMNELLQYEGFHKKPLGIVLLSANNKCKLCEGSLLVRADRPSFPVVYSNDFGTVNSTHFRKYCQNNWKGCQFTQHYGFYMIGNESQVFYEKNLLDLPYFFPSHMTAFATKLLLGLTAELLLGQISYQQRADIYNYIHGYDSVKKQCVQNVSNDDKNESLFRFICFVFIN